MINLFKKFFIAFGLLIAVSSAYANGSQWTQISSFADTENINSLIMDHNGNIYAAVDNVTMGKAVGKVYKLNSGSKQWVLVGSQSPDNCQVLTLAVDVKNNVYVGTGCLADGGDKGYVYKISAEKPSWERLGGNIGIIKALAVDSNGIVYALSVPNGSLGFLQEYKNQSWQSISDIDRSIGKDPSPDFSLMKALTIDSNDNLYIGTSYGNVFRAKDNCNLFTKIYHYDYPSGVVYPVDKLAITSDGGLIFGSWRYFAVSDSSLSNWSSTSFIVENSPMSAMSKDEYSDTVYVSYGDRFTRGKIYKITNQYGQLEYSSIASSADLDGTQFTGIVVGENSLYTSTLKHIYYQAK